VLRVAFFSPSSISLQKQKFRKNDSKQPLTVYTIQFDGLLKVTAPDKLQQAVAVGIGPSRAFGCGLLSLAPG